MARRSSLIETPGATPPNPGESVAELEQPAESAPEPAQEAPSADGVDPASIPYGQSVMTKDGLVVSTAPPPAYKGPR